MTTSPNSSTASISSHHHPYHTVSLTGDGPCAGGAAFGEELAVAVGAVGLLIATGEPLAGQARVAVGARETLAVPRLLLVRHAARRDDLPGERGRVVRAM